MYNNSNFFVMNTKNTDIEVVLIIESRLFRDAARLFLREF